MATPAISRDLLPALSEGRYADAATLARTLAAAAPTKDAQTRWSESAELLDRLAAPDPIAAFMLVVAIDLPEQLHDALLERLAAELERIHEPLLAHATLDRLRDATLGAIDQLRLRRELDPDPAEDEPLRARLVAARVREHYEATSGAGEPRALRGRAWASRAIGEPRKALTMVRQAAAREPGRFATRMLEAELLVEIADSDSLAARRALLTALNDEFPTHAAPALALARQLAHEGATPIELDEAARWFELALEREFDESVVLEFAALLERLGRIADAITLLETSHERAAGTAWQEDFARALVRLHRALDQPDQAQRWVAEVEQQVAVRERGYAIAAIALMVVLLAVLVIVLVL
ncbi:hypothetical protein ACNOYE_03080 [Nannocystaceae bacterium ST9]